jgi:hypothetical protein
VKEYTEFSGKEKLRRGKKKVSKNNLKPDRWRIGTRKGPTFRDFVTILTGPQAGHYGCKTTEYKSTDSPLPLYSM